MAHRGPCGARAMALYPWGSIMSGKKTPAVGIDTVTDVDSGAAGGARHGVGPLALSIAIFFGLFYAYDLWEAVSPLLELPGYYALVGLEISDVPWALLAVGALIPPAVYVLTFVAGLRRTALEKALIFLVGLAVVASASLTIVFLEQFLRPVAQVVGL